MAFITTYNSQRIVRNSKLTTYDLKGAIYKKAIYIFSKYEKAALLAIQELLKNPEKYFDEVYQPINVEDSFRFVYPEKSPSYHAYEDCENLNSNFENIEVPEDIRKRGTAEVERFRQWFEKNKYLKEKPDVFAMRLQIAFNTSVNPKAISYENSGHDNFKNYTVTQLEDTIDQLLRDAGKYYHDSERNQTILSKYGSISGIAFSDKELQNNNTGFTDDEIKDFLKEYHRRYKTPLKTLLVEWYRIKYNPSMIFPTNLLEAFGFRLCSICRHRVVEPELNHWNLISNLIENGNNEITDKDIDDLPF